MDKIKEIKGPEKIMLGVRKDDGSTIYFSKPTFDCGWYWGFGYLGNKNCHYHIESYQSKSVLFEKKEGGFYHGTEKRNICIHDALLADYGLAPKIKDNLWTFCELVLTIYALKKTADIYHIGGSHMTINPGAKTLINKERYDWLVFDAIPKQIQLLWDLIS